MRLKVKSLPNGIVEIENIDTELIAQYASITLYEYERTQFKHGSPLDNFLGIAGELAFRQCLAELGLKGFDYVARELGYWERDPRPYDFKLKDNRTIEIATVRPTWKYCIIKESSWKRSDYAVCVQIRRLEYYAKIYWQKKYRWFKIDANAKDDLPIEITDKNEIEAFETLEIKPIGEAVVRAYGTLQEIDKGLNGWKYGKKNEHYILTEADGRYIPLDQLHPINQFWNIISPSPTKPKPSTKTLDAYRQRGKWK